MDVLTKINLITWSYILIAPSLIQLLFMSIVYAAYTVIATTSAPSPNNRKATIIIFSLSFFVTLIFSVQIAMYFFSLYLSLFYERN